MKYRSPRQKWLEGRGGRTEEDVFIDSKGEYVFMRAWGNAGKEKVYLPDFGDSDY